MYTNRGSTSWSSGGAGDDTSSYSFDYDYLFDANQQHPAAHDYYSSWSSAWAPSANAYFSEFPTINPGDLGIATYSQPLNPTSLNSTASSMVSSRSSSNNSAYGSYSNENKLVSDSNASGTFGRAVGYQRVIGVDGQYRTVPICPDIKMKELPFYDILAVLIRPTSLLNQGQSPKQEAQHSFCLSPSQSGEITNSREVVPTESGYPINKVQYLIQVQLRFCALDSTEEQDDLFPQGLVVKVNGRPVQLPAPIPSNRPGVEPKRPSKPLNITSHVKCCPLTNNMINVAWLADATRSYCMQITMVKKLTADELFNRLKTKRIQPADFTRGRIKEITTAEEEDLCAPTSIRVSIACPLGKSRMTWPCRATTCKHLQCFDANLFLMMNERKPTFVCPVCNKHLKFGDLSIDGYFLDVIKNLSIDSGNEIELFADGSWCPALKKVKSETETVGPPAPKKMKPSEPVAKSLNETIDLDDEIAVMDENNRKSGDDSAPTSQSTTSKPSQVEPEVVDLLDSSDEEDTGPSRDEPATPQVQAHEQRRERVSARDDSEVEGGVRPRRRKKNISYVEDSSSGSSTTNEGDTTISAPAPGLRQPRSPACIELSDSPSHSPEPRHFSGIGGGGSSSQQQSSATNRSGSGSSSSLTTSLYQSSSTQATATPTSTATPAGAVATGGTNLHHSYLQQYSTALHQHPASFYSHSVSSTSASVGASPAVPGMPPTASHFFPSHMSVPGYTAFDPSSSRLQAPPIPSWDDDLTSLNSIINQHTLSYSSGAALDSLTGGNSIIDNLINASVSGHHTYSTSSSSSSSLYNHHPGGGGSSSGYAGGWM